MNVEEWREKLRTAETEADFEALKGSIEDASTLIFYSINSPEFLRVCLSHMNLQGEELLEAAHTIASRHRVDLLEVVFEYLPWEEFINDNNFTAYISNVLTGGYVDVMVFLLDRGLSVDYEIRYSYGYYSCLLTHVCHYGKVDIINLLLERGANVNKKTYLDTTPVFGALASGNIDIINSLYLRGADLNHRIVGGRTLWHDACSDSYPENLPMMRYLATMRVHLDRDIYERCFSFFRLTRRQELREKLEIMGEALKYQGEGVYDLSDYQILPTPLISHSD